MSSYQKLQPGDAMYNHVNSFIKNGEWSCDSKDHNDNTGCSNPDCFKYKIVEDRSPYWKELDSVVHGLLKKFHENSS